MSTILVDHAERPLAGSVPVPCDPLIGRRLLLLSALSSGASELTGIGVQTATATLAAALSALGVDVRASERRLDVAGVGLWGLSAPERVIACESCGDSLALLLGLVSAQRFPVTLSAAAALDTPLLAEILDLLRRRGAALEGPLRNGDELFVRSAGLPPGGRLSGIESEHAGGLPLKSALLISGLFASAPTALGEALVSIDHTERALDALRLPVTTLGPALELHPPADAAAISAFQSELPGDFAAAQLLLAAAASIPDSRVTVRDVALNVSRAGSIDWLRQLGGSVGLTPRGARLGEAVGDLSVTGVPLSAGSLGGELWARMACEPLVPLLLGSVAAGVTRLSDVALAGARRTGLLVSVAKQFGVKLELDGEMMRIAGGPASSLTPSRIASQGEPGVVMLATLFGLLAPGRTEISDADCIGRSFPRFAGTLRALGARVEVRA